MEYPITMMDAAGTFREERKNTRIITRISKINVKNLDLTDVWQKQKRKKK